MSLSIEQQIKEVCSDSLNLSLHRKSRNKREYLVYPLDSTYMYHCVWYPEMSTILILYVGQPSEKY